MIEAHFIGGPKHGAVLGLDNGYALARYRAPVHRTWITHGGCAPLFEDLQIHEVEYEAKRRVVVHDLFSTRTHEYYEFEVVA